MTTLFFNGNILTQDRSNPVASAFSVENGKITGVGRDHDFNLTGAVTVDLQGRTVLPGFNDAHIHLWKVGQLEAFMLDLRGIRSIREINRRVETAARRIPSGKWIIGRGFNEALLAEKRMPLARDLEPATSQHPVYLIRTCAHIACVNSLALQTCKIDEQTTAPEGGQIGTYGDGRPNGQFFETALGLITRHIPPISTTDYVEMIRIATRKMLAAGITAVTDPAVHPDLNTAYEQIAGDEPGLRLNLMPMLLPDGGDIPYALPEPVANNWLRRTTVKFFADGGLSGSTAALLRPYRNGSGNGILRLTPERLHTLGREVRAKGFALGTHAIGDQAIAAVLEAYAKLETEFGRCRNRIEHFGLPSDESLLEAARQKVVAVPQPVFLDELGDNFIAALDDRYLRRCYPMRTLLDKNIPMALSTDAPVVRNINPWNNIRAAVTRKTASGQIISPSEAISISEGLFAYTMGSAYAEGTENRRGSITTGKDADFIVIDEDPLQLPVEELDTIKTELVFVNGKEKLKETTIQDL